MIIQLLCSIQAFRGRNLPGVMNDGMMLAYLTFILTVVFGVSFVIVHFQPAIKKELFQVAVVLINNMVITILMYGQKAIRMLIYPERNTREYFREQRMKAMHQHTTEVMEMRSRNK